MERTTLVAHYPVTLFYASLLGLLLVFLSIQVLRYRVRADVKGAEAAANMSRVQGNFVEYVPMALVLMALLEWAGAPAMALHGLGCVLVLARVLHAIGLGYVGSRNYPRMLGALLTFLVLATMGMAGLYGALAAVR